MSKLIDTLRESNIVMKELQQYMNKQQVDLKDFLLKFKLQWQIVYLLDFLYSRYKATIFVNEKLYIVFVKIGDITKFVIDKDNANEVITETYMDAICDTIKYINKPF